MALIGSNVVLFESVSFDGLEGQPIPNIFFHYHCGENVSLVTFGNIFFSHSSSIFIDVERQRSLREAMRPAAISFFLNVALSRKKRFLSFEVQASTSDSVWCSDVQRKERFAVSFCCQEEIKPFVAT